MAMGQDCLRVGSYLVDDMPSLAEDAIRPHDHQTDTALLHQSPRGIVGDDSVADALLGKLPCGEGGSLATGAGLIAEHQEVPTLRLSLIHRGGSRADVDEGEPTRIAVGQDCHAIAEEVGAHPADRPAFLDVPISETLGCFQREVLLLRYRPALGQRFSDLTQGVDGVHSSGSSSGKNRLNFIQVSCKGSEPIPSEVPCTLRQPVGRRGANGTRTSDDHVANGRCRLTVAGCSNTMEAMRKQPLLDQDNGVPNRIEFNGSEVTDLAADQDVHRPQD
jgi:hypothetical protein